ncbi:SHOCT domain-containing protein [Sphaerisporangium sp. TRM90804]|uniref:SHOCT domain-containing protein n=1 Tax=Sphaerisporangium sp. TRM90804 TaxID=3031113 RepID=UPI00244ACC17|nr:SHOCT domain-containing protein [Sphaerisporangium sp. TRM90804]MDH2429113.1 SHOCT domain-containing protein [Sphaerisporangium sp. TRM90804]
MKTILFLIAVIVIISCVLVMVRTWKPRRAAALAPEENPREILKRRYAAGEIDEDEYLRRMSGLSQDY